MTQGTVLYTNSRSDQYSQQESVYIWPNLDFVRKQVMFNPRNWPRWETYPGRTKKRLNGKFSVDYSMARYGNQGDMRTHERVTWYHLYRTICHDCMLICHRIHVYVLHESEPICMLNCLRVRPTKPKQTPPHDRNARLKTKLENEITGWPGMEWLKRRQLNTNGLWDKLETEEKKQNGEMTSSTWNG